MGLCLSKEAKTGSAKSGNKAGKAGFTDLNYDNISAGLSVYLTGGPLTAKEYKERLSSSEGTQTITLPHSGYTLRYAYVSQRGYYPDAPDKFNQDSLCVHSYFAGDPEQVFFGVFDGHGEFGTQASQFAKDKVVENLMTNTHFAVSPEVAFHQAMVSANAQLHRCGDIDDTMSGTTAITVLIRGRMVHVANVGDSRAVLAERVGDRVVANDLSYDQTPYRRDEAERVKRCGARVLTLDQLEGLKDPSVECWGTEEEDDGDPPRLWAPNATYPGTAFTRSIGDNAAERIGVFAEPEVVTKQLTAAHPFIVIASDGVFEFLTSQSVVDMVSKFDDPQEACFSVVAESYRLWLQHETRTDDITMIVIQFQGLEDEAPQMALPTPLGAPWDYSSRAIPPHTGMALKRMPTARVAAIEAAVPSFSDDEMRLPEVLSQQQKEQQLQLLQQQLAKVSASSSAGGGAPNGGGAATDTSAAAAVNHLHANSISGQHEPSASISSTPTAAQRGSTNQFSTLHQPGHLMDRSSHEYQLLDAAVSGNFLFAMLDEHARQQVFSVFERRPVQAGDMVLRQGEQGDHFIVVESGQYDVFLQQGNEPPALVHTYSSLGGTPSSFGELALLYGKPRAATVIARTDGVLWSLARSAYKGVMHRLRESKPTVKTLRSVEVLQSMNLGQLQELADVMEQVTVNDGEYIIHQGDEGRDFYVIASGEVACTVRKNPANLEEPAKEVLQLGPGQYFGERALLTTAKRAANVIATGPVTLLRVSRDRFEMLFGPLQDIMDAQAAWQEQVAMQREVLSRKNTAGGMIQGNFSLEDLEARGLLFATDCSALLLMEHRASEDIYTVRVTSAVDVMATGKQALVLRARDITRSLEPSFFVPGVLKYFKDNRVLAEVLMTVGLCTLDMLLQPRPFDELSAMYVAASVIMGLEHLHWSGVIYRGLSVHSIIITEGGQVQLVDFRFARKNEGRAYTLCGNPEYLAPEVVENRGHTEAADYWSLGVLIYCLLTGDTPFAAEGDDELRIYRRIVTRSYTLPSHISPAAADLINRLLQHDPAQRLGHGPLGLKALKAHPWFAPMNWDALIEHRFQPPAGIRERIYNFEGVAYAQFDPQPCEGDMSWANAF